MHASSIYKENPNMKSFDAGKVENVEWFIRFPLLEKIRIARKNMKRAKKLRGLALKKILIQNQKKGCSD